MKRFLSIDNGNTSVKLTLFSGGRIVGSQSFEGDLHSADLLPFRADAALCCSVGRRDPAEICEVLSSVVAGEIALFSHDTPIPLAVRYDTPRTLGLDRVAAAVGATDAFPGEALLVADAGTALTLDIIEKGPVFIGGNISPGIGLRFRSLSEHTALLPQIGPVPDPPRFGGDTLSAIRAGVEWGVVAEISSALSEAARIHGVTRLVLSGGDAPLLAGMISGLSTNQSVVGNLVARGLYRIYTYNEHQ